MNHNDEENNKKKIVYKKPRLRVIELAAEEVLAAGCKTTTGPADALNPVACHVTNFCAGLGS